MPTEIIFRYINGILRPLPINGTYREETSSITSSYSNNDFCRLTKCPECKKAVYFIKHNGGSVWVDEKGPPWPKHPCCNKPQNNREFDKLKGAIQDIGNSMFGLVVQTRIVTNDNVSTIIAINCGDNKGRCFLLNGSHEELHEQLVTICLRKPKSRINAIIKGVIQHYDILDSEISPASIGLTQEWLKNPNKIKQVKHSKHYNKLLKKLKNRNVKLNGKESYQELKELLIEDDLRIKNSDKLKKMELNHIDSPINDYKLVKDESHCDLLKIIRSKNLITPERQSDLLLKELNYNDLKTIYETYHDNKKEPEVLLKLLCERKIYDLYFERRINEFKKVLKNPYQNNHITHPQK